MRRAALFIITTISAGALALCCMALVAGLTVIILTIRAQAWLEGESPAP